MLQTVRRLGTNTRAQWKALFQRVISEGTSLLIAQMYTETDVSGSTLSDSKKSAEKWQLGTAIPVWGTGELMKFVIKTFLYSAK